MKTYVVQLEDHDDVISVRDKIAWSKAGRVLLIWPRRGKVLARKVDLVLLCRHALQLGVQLAIITNHSEVISNARDLGIPVFTNLEQAQQVTWQRSRARQKNYDRAHKKNRLPVSAEILRAQRETVHFFEVENRWLRFPVFTAGVLAFLALAMFFAPVATVHVSLARKYQQITLPVWAQQDLIAANPSGGLPAHVQTVVVEGRDQISSSGRMLVPDGSATGDVTITNLTLEPVTVPSGSVILLNGLLPVRFVTLQSVRLSAGPGNKQSVRIRALVPGNKGNAVSGQVWAMEGPLGLKVEVTNPQPLKGGSERSSLAPSNKDYDTLREKIIADLQEIAFAELQAHLSSSQMIIRQSLRERKILQENREPFEGQPGDILQLTMQVEFEAWYLEKSDLQAIALAALDANLPAGYQPVPGSPEFEFKVVSMNAMDNPDGRIVRGTLSTQRSIQAILPENEAVREVLGQKRENAVKILKSRYSLSGEPEIDIYPTWWNRLPYLPSRIGLVKQ